MSASIDQLHRAYVQLSGHQIRLGFDRERAWFEFQRAGFTVEDLQQVLRFLQKGIKSGDRNEGCLRFRNLILNLDYFEEELAMARKVIRPRPPVEVREQRIATTDGVIARQVQHDPAAAAAPEEVGRDIAASLRQWRATVK